MASTFGELGRIGQRRWGGALYEEFLRELRGIKGVEVYKEMSDNDDIIGAVLFAIENLIRQATWSVRGAAETDEDNAAAEFVQSCMDDMDEAWSDFLSEVLSFLVYGWSYHEIVYKRRLGASSANGKSKYNDGLIGWRKLPIRSQDTLYEWAYDDSDNLLGMIQMAPPGFKQVLIPIGKALHFKTQSRKENPEGRSVLRNSYRDWFFKRRIQEIEGIGIERDLAGLPVIQPPEGTDIFEEGSEALLQRAIDIVTSIKRDESEGVVLPFGWSLSLTTTGGRRQFDTSAIIERYDSRIAMTVLADFVLLGHQSVGSFALSSDKTEMFALAIGAFLDLICEVFNNQAIPRLIDLNGDAFKGISGYPKLIHGDVESANLTELGTFVQQMITTGAITPDEPLEDYLREVSDLPDRSPDTSYMSNTQNPLAPNSQPAPAVGTRSDAKPQEPEGGGDEA